MWDFENFEYIETEQGEGEPDVRALFGLEGTVFAGLEYAALYADEFLNLYYGYDARARHPSRAARLLFCEAEKEVLAGDDDAASKLLEFCVGEDADAGHFGEWLSNKSAADGADSLECGQPGNRPTEWAALPAREREN